VPRSKAEHMAAPTNAAGVKKALANPEPSTHGPTETSRMSAPMSVLGGIAEARDSAMTSSNERSGSWS
jgi:hypothetical protein